MCVGIFVNEVEDLVEGVKFCLDLDEVLGDINCVCLFYKEIFVVLKFGVNFLVNDGKICL